MALRVASPLWVGRLVRLQQGDELVWERKAPGSMSRSEESVARGAWLNKECLCFPSSLHTPKFAWADSSHIYFLCYLEGRRLQGTGQGEKPSDLQMQWLPSGGVG